MSKKYLIAFASPDLQRSVSRFYDQADKLKFYDEICLFKLDDLNLNYKKKIINLINKKDKKRGYGYWFWKPLIIQQLLEKIQENGWTDIEDISETFTFNTSSVGRSDLAGGCCGTARGIDIRALGVASTLVLQNGKRVASTSSYEGADYTNIKALMPVIAMDRMETLLDGSAALYGSDAVAGVVNLIPRKDFEGIEKLINLTKSDNDNPLIISYNIVGKIMMIKYEMNPYKKLKVFNFLTNKIIYFGLLEI